jgi:hypothetical protein
MRPRDEEENDIPFFKNDLRNSTRGTMDKPLDTADAPGKADSELVEDGLPAPNEWPALHKKTGTGAG